MSASEFTRLLKRGAVLRWATVFAAWTVFGLAQTAFSQLTYIQVGEAPAVWSMFWVFMPRAWLWVALTPVIGKWDRWLRRRAYSVPGMVLGHIPLFLAASLLETAFRRTILQLESMPAVVPFYATLLYFADIVAVNYVAALMLSRVVEAEHQLRRRERRTAVLKEEIARAQLHYLDLQLQPHFLFNALGSVSELAHEAPAVAAQMVDHLCALLRYATEGDGGQEVTLREELDALSPYLEIQRMRFPDWIHISENIAPEAADALVPRLLMQPLVENAIRHGLAHQEKRGLIAFRAAVIDDQLLLVVRDNGTGASPSRQTPGRGIGLANIRERLTTLYPNLYSLVLEQEPEGGTEVRLTIPYRRAPIPMGVEQSGSGLALNATDSFEIPAVGAAPISLPPTPEVPLPPRPLWRHPVLATVAVWLLIGVVLTQQSWLYVVLRHPQDHIAFAELLRRHAITIGVSVVFTPIIVAVALRFPLRRGKILSRVPLHVIAALSISLLNVAATRALVGGEQMPLLDMIYLQSIFWNLAAYGVILALAHRRRVEAWIRERDRSAARLHSELATTRLSAVMLELSPDFLLSMLGSLKQLVTRDAARAEELLTSFAGYLRLQLETLGQRQITVDRELALLKAYGQLKKVGTKEYPTVEITASAESGKVLIPNGLMRAVADRLVQAAGPSSELNVTLQRSNGTLTILFTPVNFLASPPLMSHSSDLFSGLSSLSDSGAEIRFSLQSSVAEIVLPQIGNAKDARYRTTTPQPAPAT